MRKNIVVSKIIQTEETPSHILILINTILNEYFPEFKEEGELQSLLPHLSNLHYPSVQKPFQPIPDQQFHSHFILEIASILHYLKKTYQCWHQAHINSDQKEYESALLLLRLGCIYQKIAKENSTDKQTETIIHLLDMLDQLNKKVIIPYQDTLNHFVAITNIVRNLSLWVQKKIIRNGRNHSWDEIALESRRESLIELGVSSLHLVALEPKQNLFFAHQTSLVKFRIWINNIKQFLLVLWADIIDFVQRTQLGPLKKWIGLRSAEKARCKQIIQAYQMIYLFGAYDPNSQLPTYLNLDFPFIPPTSPNEVGSYIELGPFPFTRNDLDSKIYFVQKQIKAHLLTFSQEIYWMSQNYLRCEPIDGAINRTLSGIYQSILKLYSENHTIDSIEYKLSLLLHYLEQLQRSTFLSYSTSDRKIQITFSNIKKNVSNILEYIQYEHSNDAQEKSFLLLCKLRTSAYLFLWDIIDSVLILCGENLELRKFNLSTCLNLSKQDQHFQEALNETYFGQLLKAFCEESELKSHNNSTGLTRNKDEVRSQGLQPAWQILSEKRSDLEDREYVRRVQHQRRVQHRSPGSNAEFGPEPTISRKSSPSDLGLHTDLIQHPEAIQHSLHILKNVYFLFKLFNKVFPILDQLINDEKLYRIIDASWINAYERWIRIIGAINSEITKYFSQLHNYFEDLEPFDVQPNWYTYLNEHTQQFHYTEYRAKLDIMLKALLEHFSKNQFSIKVSQESQAQYMQLSLNLNSTVDTVEVSDSIETLSKALLTRMNCTHFVLQRTYNSIKPSSKQRLSWSDQTMHDQHKHNLYPRRH